MKILAALRIRPYAMLWTGQTISRLGDGLFAVALSWWVLEQTGSPAAMGFIQIFRLLPNLIFLLIGGVLADRLPRLRLMLASDMARFVLSGGIALLMGTHALQVWHIYVASLVFGFVDAFFQPAYAAVVPDIVLADQLPSANSLTALSAQAAGIIGPAMGGIIVGLGGSSLAFIFDSLSFLAAAACMLPILGRVAMPKRAVETAPNTMDELREGLNVVLSTPWLWITIFVAAFANMFVASAFSIATPFLIKDTLHADSTAYGVILSLFSVGAIIGAFGIGSLGKMQQRGLKAYFFWIAASSLVAVVGLSTSFGMISVLSVLIGVGFSAGQVLWTTLEQELVPANLLGRVSSVDQFGSFALMPVGFGLVGWATSIFGAPLIFLVGGLLAAGAMTVGLLHPAVRRLA